MYQITLLLLLFLFVQCDLNSEGSRLNQGKSINLENALQFLREFDNEASQMCNRLSLSQWSFATNITDANKRRMKEDQTLSTKFDCLSWKKAVTFDWPHLPDPLARRQLQKIISTRGRSALPEDRYNEINHLISEMKDTYNNAKICAYTAYNHDQYYAENRVNHHITTNNYAAIYQNNGLAYCDLKIDPDIIGIMAISQVEGELIHTWKSWSEKAGLPNRNKFMRYVGLANHAAKLNGFRDAGEQAREPYEDPDLHYTIHDLWTKIQPLYKQLFTYVRARLVNKYGDKVIRSDGPIPVHLLGNMWAQNWINIADMVLPYDKTSDITEEMIRQGFTPLRMFQMAEEWFTSLGLRPMPPEFWRNSMLEKPPECRVQCTASAWDFCNRMDYRIKQCTEVTFEDLLSTHHEMAHVQYYLQYSDQPFIFREGANPAFHEAIAHAVGLSVVSPVHLHRRGLLPPQSDEVYSFKGTTTTGRGDIKADRIMEADINFLMTIALSKIPFLPFALAVEQWRWHVFERGVSGMNAKWWELILHHQGVTPPIPRDVTDFDPGSKYHIVSDQEYLKYFISGILQFQIFEHLCIASGHLGHLHHCDIYRSRDAGRLFSEILQPGSSMSWQDLIRILTRGKTNRISADSILNYFRPLDLWLQEQNKNELVVGWNYNMDDVALFQRLRSSSNITYGPSTFLILLYTLNLQATIWELYIKYLKN